MSDPEKLPPFPRLCECSGYSGKVWCHGFFGGTIQDGDRNLIPHPVAVIEDMTGYCSFERVNWIQFPK